MQLDKKQFLEVIANAPLISIDLVIRDPENKILLGRRTNEPAKGKWFVPGGRIKKNESLDDAFKRISKAEVGVEYSRNEAHLIGAFTHLYDTNVFLEDNISTHYVVLAYELRLDKRIKVTKSEQHSEYKWYGIEEADPDVNGLADPDVHEYVWAYFRATSNMDSNQYQILNSRRDSFNNLVWQTPVLSLTAQAFLFTIILSGGVPKYGRTIASILAAIAALMSLQLLAKHRFMEAQHAKILHQYEEIHKMYAANRAIRSANWLVTISSYRLWIILLWFFLFASILSLALIWLWEY